MSSLYDELLRRTINAHPAVRLSQMFPASSRPHVRRSGFLGCSLLLVLAMVISGCNYVTTPVTPTITSSPTQDIAPSPAAPVSDAINPLTGLEAADASVFDRRPMVVKISNAPPIVRPQAGLGAADLVFEHYAEGGLTRFSAVFWSQAPQRVGSIRSARLIDYELTAMYQALLAYSGASDGVQRYIDNSDFVERAFRELPPYFFRDESIVVPHNLFLNVDSLYALAAQQGLAQRPHLTGMSFSQEPPLPGDGTGLNAEIDYRATTATWEYDPVSERYLRFTDGQPHLDANTGAQIMADNVVILYAHHRLTDIVESVWQGEISYSIEIELWFEGDAVLLRNGQRYDALWSRPSRQALITLLTQDGNALPLKPGVTWFQVFPPLGEQRPGEESVTVR